MVKKITNGVTDLIKIIMLSFFIAVPIYFIGDLFDIELLQWNHLELYNGDYHTNSSAIPFILGSAISVRVLKKYGKLSYN